MSPDRRPVLRLAGYGQQLADWARGLPPLVVDAVLAITCCPESEWLCPGGSPAPAAAGLSVASLNSPRTASCGVTFRDDFLIKVLPERSAPERIVCAPARTSPKMIVGD
jgi:hypothetical protein